MPLPFIMRGLNVLPAVVKVPVPFMVTVDVCEYVIPATSVILPLTVIKPVPVIVPVKPVQLIDLAPVLPVEIVQVPVERSLKNTSSADVGTA
jgi:hypothetical protein